MLEKLPPGLQQFVARIEENPPLRELQTAIASIVTVGALAIGLHSTTGSEQYAAAAERNVCTVPGCEPHSPGVVELARPDGVRPSPIAIALPPIEKKTPDTAPTTTSEQKPIERERHEPLHSFLEARLPHLPSLQDLGNEFPTYYPDWQQQLDYIEYLSRSTEVSVPRYAGFAFDSQFVGAFTGTDSYKTAIDPKLIVLHWTVNRYPEGDEGGALFAAGLQHEGMSSNYFVPHDGRKVFKYFESDHHMSAGALGMNRFGVNIELEAGRLQPEALAPQVLYDVTPQALEQMVYSVVRLARQNNLAINESTVIGHLAGDLLFANHTYDWRTGKSDSLRKFDMPQELVRVVIQKAQAIDKLAA